MHTKIKLGAEARDAIKKGVNIVYDAVKLTLGPSGGNALMFRTYARGPRITNDGVTIAEVIEPKNEFVKIVADAFKESCKKTNELAGDGTTTTTVIGGHLLNEVFASLSGGVIGGSGDVMQIKRKLLAEKDVVLAAIKDSSKEVKTIEELEKIATVSVEDEELGKLIASIVWETGVEGYVDTLEGFKGEIEHEVIRGMRFPAKVPGKAFVNNPARYEMVMDDVPVMLTNYTLDSVNEVGGVANKIFTETKGTKLAILAPSFSTPVLVEFINAAKKGYYIFPVKVPSLRTEQYEDIAAYAGAKFINKDKGDSIGATSSVDLGFFERFIVKDVEAREEAVATGGRGAKDESVKNRIEELKKQRQETKQQNHKALIDRRIASMASAVGVIRVGAPSQAEGLYLKLKVEDAVYACKAALEEGYVKGGGLCLKEIAEKNPDMLLSKSLIAPYNQIQENAGEELKIGKGIVDPTKAVRLAVQHAISVVANLITVKIIIPESRDDSPGEGYNNIAKAILKATDKEPKDQYGADAEGQDDLDIDEYLRN